MHRLAADNVHGGPGEPAFVEGVGQVLLND
jgi:hypothetical protein